MENKDTDGEMATSQHIGWPIISPTKVVGLIILGKKRMGRTIQIVILRLVSSGLHWWICPWNTFDRNALPRTAYSQREPNLGMRILEVGQRPWRVGSLQLLHHNLSHHLSLQDKVKVLPLCETFSHWLYSFFGPYLPAHHIILTTLFWVHLEVSLPHWGVNNF